jgi:hypothetical protein
MASLVAVFGNVQRRVVEQDRDGSRIAAGTPVTC